MGARGGVSLKHRISFLKFFFFFCGGVEVGAETSWVSVAWGAWGGGR